VARGHWHRDSPASLQLERLVDVLVLLLVQYSVSTLRQPEAAGSKVLLYALQVEIELQVELEEVAL